LWDVLHQKRLRHLGGSTWWDAGIAFSPDGTLLAAASQDGTLRLWDPATGTIRAQGKAERGGFQSLAFSPKGRILFTGGSDTTILMWDVAQLLEAGQRRAGDFVTPQVEDLWRRLGGADAADAAQAMEQLQSRPQQAVALFRDRLQPAPLVDVAEIRGLIKDLESDRFPARRRATRELEKLGELAEPFLRKRLAEQPPLEIRRRVEQLLEKQAGFVTLPEQLRAIRALEVLEHIGTPDAQAVLQKLAQGAPEGHFTQDAKASLKRLAKRSAPVP
jgi:hypothetical protein